MPTEASLWAKQQPIAEAALDFAIAFLGCRQGAANDKPIDSVARSRLLTILRAVSIVESRHGTVGVNQPARDPLQCGNPKDSWWRELTGQLGHGSRFVRGPKLSNLWADEVQAAAEVTAGFSPAAAFGKLAKPSDGHDDAGFTPSHSYVWGVIYLIYRINTKAGSQAYACATLSRDRLVNGAIAYNGNGDANYPANLEKALVEIGDLSPTLAAGETVDDESPALAESAGLRALTADLLSAAERPGSTLAGFTMQFDASGRLALADVRYHPPAIEAHSVTAAVTGLTIDDMDLSEHAKSAAEALQKAHPGVIFTSGRRDKPGQARAMAGNIVKNRNWIKETYAVSTERDTLQKWVDDHPAAVTRDTIAAGLLSIMDTWTDAQLVKLSRHIAGLAFDVSPASGADVKTAMAALPNLVKFLDTEGGLEIWHAEFKLKT